MDTDPWVELGRKIKAARIDQRYDVKAAAKAAGIARDTWKKVEAGESAQDTKRAAVLQFLGLDWNGEPVGGPTHDSEYVASPGERQESGMADDQVLREIRAMRDDTNRQLAELSKRLEEHIQQHP